MHLLSGGGGSGGEAWTLGIDGETGRLRSWVIGGFELLHAPLEAAFWRPPTDNDLGTSKPTGTTVAWLALERGPVRLLNSSLEEVKWDGLESSALRWCATTEPIAALHKEPPLVQTCYTVGQGGEVLVSQTLRRRTSPLPNLPRFGVRFALTGGMRELEWLGRGPNENYWDRKRGSRLGLHAAPILNMTVPYLRPQENGHREEVSYATVERTDGVKVLLVGLDPSQFGLSAHHFSDDDFGATNFLLSRHTSDLRPRNETFLHVDRAQQGVGGIDSWGSYETPMAQYTIPYETMSMSFGVAVSSPHTAEREKPHARARRLQSWIQAVAGAAAQG
ncbi:hypothetical protein EMIHUDRAFT_442098 [Emiliania huxleyi CCMP1516]|uniref:beta-galactosidase n=2 Tax=Emiliania huxleyi TaxID=2903 RepID=A0A0D3K7P1_EMIH1|nr:hypothetical protein EMIHUDRAFT_442098 [Emiliania huxleyi CCMP1516]EOD31776.1 hypothetical protein EMIHUDRAFT_442098 [Emiliania huxleyi CCMP1516]|eukprot:XP_005784205.1 hypothetical protein EMIHUDRAFT_442098 [Emiliania huxleyi CCMP1516]